MPGKDVLLTYTVCTKMNHLRSIGCQLADLLKTARQNSRDQVIKRLVGKMELGHILCRRSYGSTYL